MPTNSLNVDIYMADIREQDCEAMAGQLEETDKVRLVGITQPRRRAQFILGRTLLRKALRERAGGKAEAWRLEVDTFGKPGLSGRGAPQISLSHSRELVVCAIADVAVGLDVEYLRRRDFEAMARLLCTPKDLGRFMALPEDGQCMAFYRMWTVREATYKLLGGTKQPTAPENVMEYMEEGLMHRFFTLRPDFLGVAVIRSDTPMHLTLHTLPSLP